MSTEPLRRRPGGRYDPVRSPTLRAALAFGVVFAVVVTLAAVKVYRQYGGLELSYTDPSYQVLSDTRVRLSFTVTSKDGKPAVCLVRARDRTGAETGAMLLPIARRTDGSTVTAVSYVLATRDRAVTGEVTTCRRPAGTR